MLTDQIAYTSINEQDVINANNQINTNCNLPNEHTVTWCEIKAAHNQNFYYILKPPVQGWNGFTQAEMIAGVSNVNEQQFDTNWNVPISEQK